MTACHGHTSLCTGHDLRPVRFGVEAPRLLCAGCRSSALGSEAVVVGPAIAAEKRGVRA